MWGKKTLLYSAWRLSTLVQAALWGCRVSILRSIQNLHGHSLPTAPSWLLYAGMAGLEDLQVFLLTSTILWFCEFSVCWTGCIMVQIFKHWRFDSRFAFWDSTLRRCKSEQNPIWDSNYLPNYWHVFFIWFAYSYYINGLAYAVSKCVIGRPWTLGKIWTYQMHCQEVEKISDVVKGLSLCPPEQNGSPIIL